MTARKERLVAIGALDPAPAGLGFGMVHLREVHHIDAPPGARQSFWHRFSSPEELSDFLEAQRRAGAGMGYPRSILAMRGPFQSDRCSATEADPAFSPPRPARTIWSSLTRRHLALLKRMTQRRIHKEPTGRCPTRH